MTEENDRFTPQKRWGEKLLHKSGWTPVPNFLLRNIHLLKNENTDSLNPTQVLLLILIASYKWDDKMPFPTVGVLATQLGLSDRAVRSALKILEDREFIKRVKSKSGGPNKYDLSPLIQKLENLKDSMQNVGIVEGDHDGF
jgi:DNA-binding MarR family transcriptional regulator